MSRAEGVAASRVSRLATREAIKVGTACCGVVMLVAGCGGGGGRLSSAAYVQHASSICARADRAIARVHLASSEDDAATAHAVARIVVIQRASIDDLRELRPPEQLVGLDQRWIALLDQSTDDLELM